jgi:hypothetical protein
VAEVNKFDSIPLIHNKTKHALQLSENTYEHDFWRTTATRIEE